MAVRRTARRRWLGVAAAGSVVALVVTVGGAALASDAPNAPRTGAEPAQAVDLGDFELADLPEGEPPDVPFTELYFDDQGDPLSTYTLRDRETELDIDHSTPVLLRVAGGTVIHDVVSSREEHAYFVERGGSSPRQLDGTGDDRLASFYPVADAEGARFAWITVGGDIVVADGTTGEIIESYPAMQANPDTPSLTGFAGDQIHFTFVTGRDGEVMHWRVLDLETGEVTDFEHPAGRPTATDGDRQVALDSDDGCVAIWDTGDDSVTKWNSCPSPVAVDEFSPDGEFVWSSDVGDNSEGAIYETATGEKVADVGTETWQHAWESDDSIVLNIRDHEVDRNALVRCDLAGNCERITEPRTDNDCVDCQYGVNTYDLATAESWQQD